MGFFDIIYHLTRIKESLEKIDTGTLNDKFNTLSYIRHQFYKIFVEFNRIKKSSVGWIRAANIQRVVVTYSIIEDALMYVGKLLNCLEELILYKLYPIAQRLLCPIVTQLEVLTNLIHESVIEEKVSNNKHDITQKSHTDIINNKDLEAMQPIGQKEINSDFEEQDQYHPCLTKIKEKRMTNRNGKNKYHSTNKCKKLNKPKTQG